MENAFGQPQTVVVLGGSSDIAREVTKQLCAARARTVVLAGRNETLLSEAAKESASAGATATHIVTFDAQDVASAETAVSQSFAAIGAPVDLVIIAVGLLGDQLLDENDPEAAARMSIVNYAWPVTALAALRQRMIAQGSGRIVVISSVAGIRVRRGSYLYSGAKAGLDRLCEGLADSLIGTGVSVQIVRPGFVHTKMTTGLKPAPFSVDAQRVAKDILHGLGTPARVIYSPSIMKWLFALLRHLPAPLWRKINEDR
jgi:decaprenylphospho-beta-D-erythro-pentofuranosid-2-ulose 2-reductase